jgi:signal transduction histidine kinase
MYPPVGIFLGLAMLFFTLLNPIRLAAADFTGTNDSDTNPDVDEGDYQKMGSSDLIKTNGPLPTLITADEIMRLKAEEAQLGFPVDIRGVVTCVVQEHNAFIIQDSTRAVFVANTLPASMLPRRGELLEVRGKSDKGTFAPLIRASDLTNLGVGTLPKPVLPTWDQLINGSLDDQRVELNGIVEQGIPKPPGYPSHWAKIILRTTEGPLSVDVWLVGTNFDNLTNYEDAIVRVRGCLFVALTTDTHQLELGHVRMYVDAIDVDQPASSDKFSAPEKRAANLTQFDPQANAFQRVRLSGQILYMNGRDYVMMDGTNGIRFTLRRSVALHTGDYADVVGYPELNGAAPHLRSAVARKIGHGPLPKPRSLSPDDFPDAIYDATRVRIEGSLVSSRSSTTNEILEIQSGSWRFVARVKLKSTNAPPIGSRLGLTGVYFAQGGSSGTQGNVAPFDLLVHSPADITILSKPSWWTLPRLLVVVGVLVLASTLLALWVTQLHHQVDQRTTELAAQIHNRELVERQRAMEQERARIARDLHDELGSGITEISMLATVAGSAPAPANGAGGQLTEIGDRAREMVAALDEIVWAMNPKHDSLESLASYSFLYADRLLKLANIACLLKGAADLPDRPVSSVARHESFLAFKEAINNVVRHSGATNVRVAAQLIGDRLRLSIADNGRGLSTGTFTGDGLVNMRARLEKMGGRFAITSRQGRGTTVRFYIPLG